MKRISLLLFLLVTGCTLVNQQPITTVSYVNLERFMGNWYVIANIPTFIEKGVYNAIESYAMTNSGTIATTFSFNAGSVDGERKVYSPTGFVKDKLTNSVWEMQFIWPFKADYRIIYLDEAYSLTVIGRNKRDYVWIMARTPSIDDQTYQQLLSMLSEQGYDVDQIQKVPQQWEG